MTLTSEYQFVGRSNYVPSNADWYNYYILLYAKTVEDIATGRHTVYVKQRLACDNGFSFYGYDAAQYGDSYYNISINVYNDDWE